MLDIYLVRWTAHVARACRLSWTFGADRLFLVDSVEPVRHHLFSARRLPVLQAEDWPRLDSTLILEVHGRMELSEVDWSSIQAIVVGGASCTLPRGHRPSARIPGRPPCLIGDQALAIALYCRQEALRHAAAQQSSPARGPGTLG